MRSLTVPWCGPRGASLNHGPGGPSLRGKLSLLGLIPDISAAWDAARGDRHVA